MQELENLLLDLDHHVRDQLIHNLITVFRRAMALHLDLDAFTSETEKMFSEAKLISKGMIAYWRKNQQMLEQQYQSFCPFDTLYTGIKWVANYPTDSKYGLTSPAPCIRAQIETTNGNFSLDFTQNGLVQLAECLQKIQDAIQQ